MFNTIPVSYTHLDVYKRQEYGTVERDYFWEQCGIAIIQMLIAYYVLTGMEQIFI